MRHCFRFHVNEPLFEKLFVYFRCPVGVVIPGLGLGLPGIPGGTPARDPARTPRAAVAVAGVAVRPVDQEIAAMEEARELQEEGEGLIGISLLADVALDVDAVVTSGAANGLRAVLCLVLMTLMFLSKRGSKALKPCI